MTLFRRGGVPSRSAHRPRTDEMTTRALENAASAPPVTRILLIENDPRDPEPKYAHLDIVFSILGGNHALVYEHAFNPASLDRIHREFTSVVPLTDQEQQNAGANVLCLSPGKVLSISENRSVNEKLVQLGLEVVTVPFSEVIKSGGSVRCDTLPVEREQ